MYFRIPSGHGRIAMDAAWFSYDSDVHGRERKHGSKYNSNQSRMSKSAPSSNVQSRQPSAAPVGGMLVPLSQKVNVYMN